jgi:phosphoribosylaminoimidazole-succinocarboxamide synthase
VLTADAFLRSGKVRDLYELPDRRLLLVASDRISAFDVILPSEIPDKGRVLTGLSRFWFAETDTIVPNHLLDTDVAVLRDAIDSTVEASTGERSTGPHSVDDLATLRGRIMVCQPASVVPIEAVVRGYLAGSGWREYQASGTVCGIPLPAGLREADQLPAPIFTPATKAELGEHDENIDFDGMVAHIAASPSFDADIAGPIAEAIRTKAIALYRYASAVAARGGILLADTKFEFGLGFAWASDDGDGAPELERIRGRRTAGRRPADRNGRRVDDQIILIDEALTPDSSRFWDAAAYEPGRAQASFDKQFVRDWLEGQPWAKTAPGPSLPDDVIAGTRRRYVDAYERITGASFDRYLQEDVIAR